MRDGIVTTLTKDQGTQAALAAAQAARGKLAGGASIEAVAQELKVSAEPAHFIGRTDPSVPAQVRDAAFALPAPAAGKPAFSALTLNTGGAAVVAVSAVRTGAVHDDKERSRARTRGSRAPRQRCGARPTSRKCAAARDVKKNPNAFD